MIRKVCGFAGGMLGLLLVLSATAGVAHAQQRIPEIDAGSAASALTLLAGAVMLVKDKFRAR
jgi:hypothetical protein